MTTITTITEDTRETTFLFQRLSTALQRGNAVSFFDTMVTELKRSCNHFSFAFSFNFCACGFVLVGNNSNKKKNIFVAPWDAKMHT